MKKFLLLLLTCMVIFSYSSNQKVLIFVRDGSPAMKYMLENEAGVMKKILSEAGYKVSIATISGEEIKNDSVDFKPDLKLSDVNPEDYAGFMLPCMAAGSAMTPEMVAFTRKVVELGKPVAAQTNAVLILAKAGGLKNRKYAFYTDVASSRFPEFGEGVYSGNGVIRDENIITSAYCPWMAHNSQGKYQDCTTELTRTFIAALGKEN